MNDPIAVILDDPGMVLVPWEVLEKDSFTVSVFAGDLITTNIAKVRLYRSGYESGRDAKSPTPSVYQHIIDLLERKGDGLVYQNNILKLLSGEDEVARVTILGSGDGNNVREIELKNDGSYIQWHYVGDDTWTNLVSLDDIRGKTPVIGVDYFTKEDISSIEKVVKDDLKVYIDTQIGGVLNESY